MILTLIKLLSLDGDQEWPMYENEEIIFIRQTE